MAIDVNPEPFSKPRVVEEALAFVCKARVLVTRPKSLALRGLPAVDGQVVPASNMGPESSPPKPKATTSIKYRDVLRCFGFVWFDFDGSFNLQSLNLVRWLG